MSTPFCLFLRRSVQPFAIASLGLAFSLVVPVAQAQLPSVVAIGAREVVNAPTGVSYSAALGKTARDAAGNIFLLDPGTPQIVELPVSGPVQLIVGSTDASLTGDANSVEFTVDPAGNLYIGHGSKSATITEVPRNPNGTYNLAGETTVASGLGALTNNFYQTSDLAVDSLGNIYVISSTGNAVGTWTGKGILMIGPSVPAGKYLVGGAGAPTNTPTSITVDGSGNVFYADSKNVYEITAASVLATTPVSTQIGYYGGGGCTGCTSITAAGAVSLDRLGNIYVNQTTHSLLVIVNSTAGYSLSSATYNMPGTISGNASSGIGCATDNQGNFYCANGGSFERWGAGTYSVALGANVYGVALTAGSTASTTTAKDPTVSYLFTASTTLNATTPYAILNAGSVNGGAASAQYSANTGANTTCAASTYAIGASCNVSISYSARQPGMMNGAQVLYDSTGKVLNVVSDTSVTAGAAATIDPGIQSVVGTGYTAPAGVAVDAAGNMYVADPDSNSVLKYAAGSTAAGTSIGSGLSLPSGVAIDAAGDLFIADTGNDRVVVIPNNVSGLVTANQTTVVTTGFALSSPRGVAVDGSGILYIADTGNSRVLQLANPYAGSVNAAPVTVGTGFTSPYAIAVDTFNNIYVADKGANSVIQVPTGLALTLGSVANSGPGIQASIGTGLNAPTGVAVDASGTVYIADGGNARVVKVPSEAGVLTNADQTVLYSGLNKPFGIATDVTGDLYYTDQMAPSLVYVQRSAASGGVAATLAFGAVAVNGSNSITSTLSNSGLTTSLAVTAIAAPAAPFTRGTASTSDCGTAPTVLAGKSCNVALTYSPTTAGAATAGTLTFTDNALGITNATQKASLTGVGSGAISSVSLTGQTTAVFGDGVSFTVTAKDASGNPSVAGNGTYTVNITGTATSSASVTLNGGTGTFFLPSLNVGTYNLSVTVGGIASPTATITLSKAPLALTANNVSRPFDVANPALLTTYSGFANGDTASVVTGAGPTISTSATRVSPYGNYPITLTGGSLTAANYTITLVNGNFAVTGSVPQTIIFPALPAFTHTITVTLTGQSTSGLPLLYSVTGGSVSGNVLTISAAGTVTVTAEQPGNSTYAPATSVTRTFTAQ